MQPKSTDPRSWKYSSSSSEGFHTVVSPEISECREVWVFRLNLHSGGSTVLESDTLELSAVVISGKLTLTMDQQQHVLERFDSFYLPANCSVTVTAVKDLFLYVGGALYEGEGCFLTRQCDCFLPLGALHQIHGKPPYEREVFMTLDQGTPASRLITGLTWSRSGGVDELATPSARGGP